MVKMVIWLILDESGNAGFGSIEYEKRCAYKASQMHKLRKGVC